jgi:hypothetical protein
MEVRRGWIWKEVMGYFQGSILNLPGGNQKVMDASGKYAYSSKVHPSILVPTWTRYV